MAKTVWTFFKALDREEAVVVSPWTTSTRLARRVGCGVTSDGADCVL